MTTVTTPLFPEATDYTPLRFNTLSEWLCWQESLHFTAIELGLDRCRKVAERMNLLKPDFTIINIAGTNGKGSSAAMLEMIMRNSGYRVGSYTSPHLIRYNERISIHGREVTDAVLCRSFNRIDQARGDISLTYFEFGTLAALDIFQQSDIELAIMEVGLGGRLDAVNMLDADVALVSTIDLDHEYWLGNDRESIGLEKAGIFRSMRPAICSDLNPPASISNSAATVGAQLYLAGRDFSFEIEENTWNWQTADKKFKNLPKPSINNDMQVRNASGVLMVLTTLNEKFPVTPDVLYASLREFNLSGRFQIIPGEIPVILDVAHNHQAVSALVENLGKLAVVGRTHVILGMLKDKNHHAVMQELFNITDSWYIVSLDSDRAANAEQLASALSGLVQNEQMRTYQNVSDALDAAQQNALPGDRIVITGSFLTVGAAIRKLQMAS